MTAPGQTTPSQGDVLISNPSPLTGQRELSLVASADIYNAAGGPTVLIAEIEIETGTRYRATAYATETDYAGRARRPGGMDAGRHAWRAFRPLD